jgi:hypothetical protein
MSILDNILKKREELLKRDPTGQIAALLQEQSLAAILGGVKSKEWETYMMNFIEPGNTKQLARLTAKDETANDPYMRKAIAYLVSNAGCGAITARGLANQLEDGILDSGL